MQLDAWDILQRDFGLKCFYLFVLKQQKGDMQNTQDTYRFTGHSAL